MSRLLPLVLATLISTSANATPFAGIYRPDYPEFTNWSCRADQVGMDGGAVAILNNQILGVENTCDMDNPRPLTDQKGMAYTLTCAGEGETYRETAEITRTPTGIRINRSGGASDWIKCDQPAASDTGAAMGNGDSSAQIWEYGEGEAAVTAQGVTLALACDEMLGGGVYLRAILTDYCTDCAFDGEFDGEFELTFTIDGKPGTPYTFRKGARDGVWESELDFAPTWDEGIIAALMRGGALTLSPAFESDAPMPSLHFSLKGSGRAIKQMRAACVRR